jgi:hypothetical protein
VAQGDQISERAKPLRLLAFRYGCVGNGNVNSLHRTMEMEKARIWRAISMVEMRGLEPLTPYMRSKCSTS